MRVHPMTTMRRHATAAAAHPTHPAAASGHHAKTEFQQVKLKMSMDMKGPDGKIHDMTMPADFTVQRGTPVRLTIVNTDEMAHSFTSTDLGVNLKVPGAKDGKPTTVTVTFTPTKAGTFAWRCTVPCDPYAMSHDGFMKGHVTVK